jgi:hypothetical protein
MVRRFMARNFLGNTEWPEGKFVLYTDYVLDTEKLQAELDDANDLLRLLLEREELTDETWVHAVKDYFDRTKPEEKP